MARENKVRTLIREVRRMCGSPEPSTEHVDRKKIEEITMEWLGWC